MMSYQVGQKNKFVDLGVADAMQLELLDIAIFARVMGIEKKSANWKKMK